MTSNFKVLYVIIRLVSDSSFRINHVLEGVVRVLC